MYTRQIPTNDNWCDQRRNVSHQVSWLKSFAFWRLQSLPKAKPRQGRIHIYHRHSILETWLKLPTFGLRGPRTRRKEVPSGFSHHHKAPKQPTNKGLFGLAPGSKVELFSKKRWKLGALISFFSSENSLSCYIANQVNGGNLTLSKPSPFFESSKINYYSISQALSLLKDYY